MIINNVELEDIDILDVDTIEKYEKAIDIVQKEVAETKGLKMSVMIRKQCIAVFNCFNTIFGEGTDKRVFGDKVNLRVCLAAFDELITNFSTQFEDVKKLSDKYSPNRLQRRSKK